MNNIIDKWHKDKKYQAKIKLILYLIFVTTVAIFAISTNNRNYQENSNEINQPNPNTTNDLVIKIPLEYHYEIDINIDNMTYKYYGDNQTDKMTITKEKQNSINNYIYQNNEYYELDNSIPILVTKEEVYDIINENYINLNNINNYLSKSIKNGNQYYVYLKDIILNDSTEEYFVININDNIINIDYTPLMNRMNNDFQNYSVKIIIENIE